jgi:hypothetical protein
MNWIINKEKDYLGVVINGVFELREVETIIENVVKVCQDTTCQRLLVDTRQVTGRITIMDRYQIGMLVVRYNRNCYKVAIVSAEEHILPSRYLQTVINNRWIPVLVTPTYEEAELWLTEVPGRSQNDNRNIDPKSLRQG